MPEALQLREALSRQFLLGLQLLAQDARLGQFAFDDGDALALRALEFGQLLPALAIFLLAREFRAELLEPLAGGAPQRLELVVSEALVTFVRAPEVLLERGHLLLDAHRRAFLQLQPVEQAVTIVVERREFFLELDPIAEEREQPLVFDGGFAAGEAEGQPAQAFRQTHAPQPAPLA